MPPPRPIDSSSSPGGAFVWVGDQYSSVVQEFTRDGAWVKDVGWRADSSRIIAWFGDAPGHDPSGGHSLADVTAALTASPGIRIVVSNPQP